MRLGRSPMFSPPRPGDPGGVTTRSSGSSARSHQPVHAESMLHPPPIHRGRPPMITVGGEIGPPPRSHPVAEPGSPGNIGDVENLETLQMLRTFGGGFGRPGTCHARGGGQ